MAKLARAPIPQNSRKLTQEKLPEHLSVVQGAGARLITNRVPHQTRIVHYCAVDDRTWHVAEDADGKLNYAHRHRFV